MEIEEYKQSYKYDVEGLVKSLDRFCSEKNIRIFSDGLSLSVEAVLNIPESPVYLEDWFIDEVKGEIDRLSYCYGSRILIDNDGCILVKERYGDDFTRFSDPAFSFGLKRAWEA